MSEIPPAEAAKWLAAHPVVAIVDCRERDEFEFCRIPGAELIPLSVWGFEAEQKLPDKSRPVLIYCHHGMRSQTAAIFLSKRGYTDVRSLGGGIDAWSSEIDPSIPKY